jgi:hypothetical protein
MNSIYALDDQQFKNLKDSEYKFWERHSTLWGAVILAISIIAISMQCPPEGVALLLLLIGLVGLMLSLAIIPLNISWRDDTCSVNDRKRAYLYKQKVEAAQQLRDREIADEIERNRPPTVRERLGEVYGE